MILHFCPQCGSKLQTGFKFCPACGEKLPCVPEQPSVGASDTPSADPAPASSSSPALHRPKLRSRAVVKAQNVELSSPEEVSVHICADADEQSPQRISSPKKPQNPPKLKQRKKLCLSHDAELSPRCLSSPRKRKDACTQVKEEEVHGVASSSPSGPSIEELLSHEEEGKVKNVDTKVPSPVKHKAKRIKRVCVLEPLPECDEISDTAGRKWRLLKLLSQTENELIYAVQQVTKGALSKDYKHILKLGNKDGRIFNEQNFLQRAARPAAVEKWKKTNKMDFLGIPTCEGFGLHGDAYRFLILPNMGRPLQTILEEQRGQVLSHSCCLKLAFHLLHVLEYIHVNEYAHADLHAEHIYINPSNTSQVYLSGYCHAFRFSPGGKHVEYREGSRSAHEGAVEFISLDSHKGAGPSRRSDLQALGYCMLRWLSGRLPWSPHTDCPARVATEKQRYMTDVPGLLSHCFGKKKVPGGLLAYVSLVMSLQYTEKPDYEHMRMVLHGALQQLGQSLDEQLDLHV